MSIRPNRDRVLPASHPEPAVARQRRVQATNRVRAANAPRAITMRQVRDAFSSAISALISARNSATSDFVAKY